MPEIPLAIVDRCRHNEGMTTTQNPNPCPIFLHVGCDIAAGIHRNASDWDDQNMTPEENEDDKVWDFVRPDTAR